MRDCRKKIKFLQLESPLAVSNDTKIQKYMSPVNFFVMSNKMTAFPCIDTSLTQLYYRNCSVVRSNDALVIAALQPAKPLFYPQASLTQQNRITEFYIPTVKQVQSISPQQESTENSRLGTSLVLSIKNIALGFLETLKKALEFKLEFSYEWEPSRAKVGLKTHLKCD